MREDAFSCFWYFRPRMDSSVRVHGPAVVGYRDTVKDCSPVLAARNAQLKLLEAVQLRLRAKSAKIRFLQSAEGTSEGGPALAEG